MSPPNDPKRRDGSPPAEAEGIDRSSALGYVAHEIRNPLSTALWTAELLCRLSPEERGGARGEKLAGICLRSVSRIRLLVEDHLLCERLDAGGYPLRPEPVRLAEFLEALGARQPQGGGRLALPAAGALAVRVDRGLLERAVDALVAVAGAGEVEVRLEVVASDGRVELRVCGAPPGSLADPGKGAPSDQRGRALALPMARRVAVALGGELTVAGEGYLLSIPAA